LLMSQRHAQNGNRGSGVDSHRADQHVESPAEIGYVRADLAEHDDQDANGPPRMHLASKTYDVADIHAA